ncbi:hypothetical protein P879_02016 [Paragonimus westermani]|uniref:Protein kinase domain-containing protein n=1 Tax=Paragonimus westermani TaxID=34504 RepID=A0A8T0D1K2_9TREM|nr:hypothetical protein P879_02016 [Paragonimus westermani]
MLLIFNCFEFMRKGEVTTLSEEELRPAEFLSSFLSGPKKDDVVFFRMDTPSQLEKEYDFGPVLGEGTFGVVYRGVRKKDNAKCAIKKILRERTYSASERARLDREISILRLVRHPGIIELLAVAESPSILFIITELCDGNTLAHSLNSIPDNSGLEEYVVVEIVRQVASSLSYLHNRGIIHRDLKTGNIMLLNRVTLDYRDLSVDKSSTHVPRTPLKEAHLDPEQALKKSAMSNTLSVPTITDMQLTQSPAEKRSINPRTAARPKNVRNNVKHSAPASVIQTNAEVIRKPLPTTSTPSSGSKSCRLPIREECFNLKQPPAALRTKLIDFGLAIEVRKNEEALGNPCGTPLYMAPEVLNGRSYTRQCDVWSLGIIMYQLLTGQLPFTAQNEEQLLEQINNFDVRAILQRIQCITILAQECLTRVLHLDPAYRYSASELLLDPWISQFVVTSQDDQPVTELTDRNSCVVDGYTDISVRASLFASHLDSTLSKTGNSVCSRPPSVGLGHSMSTYPATNVLELMKQYHRELTGNKQDTIETSTKSE